MLHKVYHLINTSVHACMHPCVHPCMRASIRTRQDELCKTRVLSEIGKEVRTTFTQPEDEINWLSPSISR